jgi:GNAT superfamily N-acetyltransferase
MPDMLVKLYKLPPLEPVLQQMQDNGVHIRRAIAPEKHLIAAWISQHFWVSWASECDATFGHQPVGCFIATENKGLLGFSAYDASARGFFGPTGVLESARGRGIGHALLLVALHDMRAQGYGYGIIGAAGPVDFYAKAVGATVIEDSMPGIYEGLLKE